MIKKFTMCIKKLFKKLAKELEGRVPGYLAYCEDCGHLKRVTFLKDTQKFMCRECIDRYVKLYIKMNDVKSRNWAGGLVRSTILQ